jgi:hypothetical protein
MRRKVLMVVAAALGVAAAIYGPRGVAFLRIGTTFAAQQTCACLHVSARPLDACLGDLGKAGHLLDIRAEGDSVRASALFGVFSGEALHEAPYGCHPVK